MTTSASRHAATGSAGKTEKTLNDARLARHQALADVRRELILDAARSVFLELGIEKTSMRQIAQRAGYTAGAIYSYFANKEELYGALLGESLDRLNQHVQRSYQGSSRPVSTAGERLHAAASAFFEFYRENPRDLDLGFYLFHGMEPRGLTPQLNAALNARLREALQPIEDSLMEMGMAEKQALQEVTSLFAHAVGLLVLGQTGRIRMFKQSPEKLFNTYVSQVIERAGL